MNRIILLHWFVNDVFLFQFLMLIVKLIIKIVAACKFRILSILKENEFISPSQENIVSFPTFLKSNNVLKVQY